PRRVERVGALARRPLDLREGAPGAARLGVLDRTRRELGEERHQWALGWYLGPLTPNPAFDRMKPTIGPRTKSTAAATMSQSCEKNSATVPTASATSMMRTAVQAAGECPWPGSPMGFVIGVLLVSCGNSSILGDPPQRSGSVGARRVVAAREIVPRVDGVEGAQLGRARRRLRRLVAVARAAPARRRHEREDPAGREHERARDADPRPGGERDGADDLGDRLRARDARVLGD